MKNVSIALLNIVKDIKCANYDTSGNVVKVLDIPIIYNVCEKDYYARLINHWWDFENVEQNKRFYVSKPRTNLSFIGMSYDARRQSDSNAITEYLKQSIATSGIDISDSLTNLNPTPYNFDYMLEIKTESWLHLTEILEQFLVYFNPCAQISVKEFNDINIARDLKVSITSIGFTINEDKDSFGYKTADCSIGLSVEGYLYKPLSNTGIIKEIISNYFTAENTTIITSASTI
jgi:hypothetical protein